MFKMVSVLANRKVNEQKKLQELLRQQILLTRFGELALRSDSLDEILTEACRLVAEAMNTSLAKVVELQEDGESLLVRAGVGWKPGVVGVAAIKTADNTSEAHALKTHEPMISPDIGSETRFSYPPFLVENGVQAVVNVIILSGKNRPPFGILQVDSITPREFTKEDIVFLQSYANLLAAAVDRLRVEAQLRESEARLGRAVSAAGMGTWEWNPNNDMVKHSGGFEALFDREIGTVESLAGLERSIHPEDWPKLRAALDRALQSKSSGGLISDFRVAMPHNQVRWLRATGTAEFDHDDTPIRMAGVTQDITSSRDAEKRIAFMALHDGLTGLINRSALREQLEHALLRSRRGEGCAVLSLDLDRFKDVNDTFGHAVGDALLCSVASRLIQATRETDVVARPGGDEFVIIQMGLHHPHDVEPLVTRIIEKLSKPYQINGRDITIGVSIGIALVPTDGTEVEEVLRCADLALYGAKGDSIVRFRFFEPAMHTHVKEHMHLVADLRLALVREEFELHYQPLIDLTENVIIGFEALVRWRHPVRGVVPPAAFIPAAEETGLIGPLGEWILFKACADAAAWPLDMKIAVNLSVVQFSKGNLPMIVASALEESGLKPERLELEITESLLLQDTATNLDILCQLRDEGISICMDDFGIGYSSLSYLSKFPFDKVKIDRSFIAGASAGTSAAAIIRAVAEMCRSLGITTTAEGIETRAQLQQVVNLGCTEGQGYLFAPPRPVTELPALLETWSHSDRLSL